jgi:5-methylcytosine-specific restriction endonuclease McrA
MPIRPENKARYPKDWLGIRTRILDRAKNEDGQPCCEECGVPNSAWGYRDDEGNFTESIKFGDGKYIKIVLTIAHLDHTPENNDPENLRAWCQRCHNRYDAPMRRRGIKQRLRATKALGELI